MTDAGAFTDLHEFAYQITGLQQRETFVRVSAVNSLGASYATHAWPINDTACNTMPTHCSVQPTDMLLFIPISPYVQLSYQEVANRLEVSWQQPTHDQYGFITTSEGQHTPSMPSHYRVEWSAQEDFANSSWYDIRMLKEENSPVDCLVNCSRTIGEEVQVVGLKSTNGDVFDGGEFSLLYVGEQSGHAFVQVRHGRNDISILDTNTSYAVGDFIRISGTVFQITGDDAAGNVTLNMAFVGGHSDAVMAYIASAPSTCLPHDASAAAVDTYLEGLFQSDYPLYNDIFDVTWEPNDWGNEWIVTFQGEMFMRNVEELVVISSADVTFTHPCNALETSGVATTLGQGSVVTMADAGSLAHGEANFVRVLAINGNGNGPSNVCEVSEDGYLGALIPRSPPGLPLNVLVWAVPSSDGSILKVTWAEGETYGNSITKYSIEFSEGISNSWTVVDVTAEMFGSNKTFEYLIDVEAGDYYTVRVRQHNDQGASGPNWFDFVGYHDATAVRMITDFNAGAQRCIPTCYPGLDECSEDNEWMILARGLPEASPLQVPNFPTVDTSRAFTKNSVMI